MDFNVLDKQMRVYETFSDLCVPPEMYIVARLDGRSFTKLTKEKMEFEAPFDYDFNCLMVSTVKHLMENSGFNFIYGYTESDEISLLFHRDETLFNRKLRKLNSTLAGEASAIFTYHLNALPNGKGLIGTFDCRISILPTISLIVDYFRWRMEDAHRNSLNSWTYWTMRKEMNYTKEQATERMYQMPVANKNEYLFRKGINYNDLPAWQKRGVGLHWTAYDKRGINPKTGEEKTALRRKLSENKELPMGDLYATFIRELII